jgi:hypothetical protein
MKRTFLILISLCLVVKGMNAQEPSFGKGDKVLNLGVGFGSTLYSGTYYFTQIPPISGSVEIGVADEIAENGAIGIGGYLAFSSYKYEYGGSGWKTSDFIIGARGNFHYPFVDKLDTYAGLMIGCSIISNSYFGSYSEDDYTGSSSGLQWSLFIGGRYYFKENIAAMLEFGYGVAVMNLGIAIKF